MEKALIIVLASGITANEANSRANSALPFTTTDVWFYGGLGVAAVLSSLATESSKRKAGDAFFAPAFLGNVGVGVMAGIMLPLMLAAIYEHVMKLPADGRASFGLTVLGAYIGRDVLAAMWSGLQSFLGFLAKLKGVQISFKPPDAPKKDGESSDP